MQARFTDTEREAIRILRAAGMLVSAIARGLNRSERAIYQQFERLDDPPAAPSVRRACLRCSDIFNSPHRGVRMCDPCRRADNSPFEAEW